VTGEERAPSKTKMIVMALVVSLIASLVLLGGAIYIKSRQENELKQSLIESCENSPVRGALTEILTEEIEESHSPLTAKVAEALHLTKKEFEEVIAKTDDKKQDRIEQIEPSDCEAQYK
jgi:Na+-transporting NADH:ubiquinone oxidoreductase subunit NqrC